MSENQKKADRWIENLVEPGWVTYVNDGKFYRFTQDGLKNDPDTQRRLASLSNPRELTTQDKIKISEELQRRVDRGEQVEDVEGFWGGAAAGAASTLSGLTFGVSDVLAGKAIGLVDEETEKRYRQWRATQEEVHPNITMVAEVGGAMVPAVLSGGTSLAGSGVKALAKKAGTLGLVGATAGGGFSAQRQYIEGDDISLGELAVDALVTGVISAGIPVLGTAASGAKKAAVRKASELLKRTIPKGLEGTQKTLAEKASRQLANKAKKMVTGAAKGAALGVASEFIPGVKEIKVPGGAATKSAVGAAVGLAPEPWKDAATKLAKKAVMKILVPGTAQAVKQIRQDPKARAELIGTASLNRESVMEYIDQYIIQQGLSLEDTKNSIEHANQIMDDLFKNTPQPQIDWTTGIETPPNQKQLREFNYKVEATLNPFGIIDRMTHGTYNPNELAALKDAHPMLFMVLAQEALNLMQTEKLTYQQKMRLKNTFGMVDDYDMRFQDAYSEGAEGPPATKNGRKPTEGQAKRMVGSEQTPLQKIS